MKNLKETVAALSHEDRSVLMRHLREALYHIIGCWDALREAEQLLGEDAEIETDAIEYLASTFDDPEDCYKATEKDLLGMLAEIEVN